MILVCYTTGDNTLGMDYMLTNVHFLTTPCLIGVFGLNHFIMAWFYFSTMISFF